MESKPGFTTKKEDIGSKILESGFGQAINKMLVLYAFFPKFLVVLNVLGDFLRGKEKDEIYRLLSLVLHYN